MKIDPNTPFLKSVPSAPPADVTRTAAAAVVTAAPAPARSAPAQLASTKGDFDAARVAEIRKSIAEGNYRIDSGKIADGLLATVRDLLGPTKGQG